MFIEYPNQRVPFSTKQKPEWYIPMYDYIIAKAIGERDIDAVKKRILAANGIIEDSEFKYLTAPINTSGVKIEMPGGIRDIDFINPVREKSISAYIQLPYHAQVKVNNPDVSLKRSMQLREAFEELMYKKFAEKIKTLTMNQQQGGNPPSAEDTDFMEFKKKFLAEWVDERAEQGQHILNTINSVNDFTSQRITAFNDYWSTEEFYTYRHIVGNDVITEIVPPQECFPVSNGEEYVEDYDAFVRIYPITYVDFMNKLPNLLNAEQFKILQQHIIRDTSGQFSMPYSIFKLLADGTFPNEEEHINDDKNVVLSNITGDFTMYHIVYKTEKEVKILKYLNAIGQECEMPVDSDYTVDPEIGDISVSTEYISEWHEGYRIGHDTEGISIKPKVGEVQRRDENNPRKIKLPYGGKDGILRGVFKNPIPTRLVPYLVYYKIIHLHIERTLAKYQSAIKFIPKNLLEGDEEMTRKEKVWFMKSDNMVLYDSTEVTPNEIAQGVLIKGDPDVANYIKTLMELRVSFKQEAYELGNMNDEMVGQGDPRGNVTNNNNNIAMARLGSILATRMFNKAWEKDHMANLEYSKVAFENRGSISYSTPGGEAEYHDIDPNQHNETMYGIVVSSADEDEKELKKYEDFAFNASQNGNLDVAFEAMQKDNVAGIRRIIRKLIETNKEFEQRKSQNEQANAAQSLQDAKDMKSAELQNNLDVANIKATNAIEVKNIEGDIEILKMGSTDMDKDGKDDGAEMMIKNAAMRLAERSQSFTEKKHADDMQMKTAKLNLDKKKVEVAAKKKTI